MKGLPINILSNIIQNYEKKLELLQSQSMNSLSTNAPGPTNSLAQTHLANSRHQRLQFWHSNFEIMKQSIKISYSMIPLR